MRGMYILGHAFSTETVQANHGVRSNKKSWLNESWKREAVQKGYAEWTVNQKDGATTWHWKEPK
jgi:hypothetical protein